MAVEIYTTPILNNTNTGTDNLFQASQKINQAFEDIETNLGTAASANLTTSPTDTTAGRVLKVGDGGLLAGATGVTETINADTVNVTRIGVKLNAASTNFPDSPDGGVFNHYQWAGSDAAYQTFHRNGTSWERFRWGSVWGGWRKNYNTGNVATSAQNLLANGSYGLGVFTPRAADFNSLQDITHFDWPAGTVGSPTGTTFANLRMAVNADTAVDLALRDNSPSNGMYFRGKEFGVEKEWRRVYDNLTIVGSVAQFGGAPTSTSAIIEIGSNADGRWTKYACGTMICDNSNAAIVTNPQTFVGAVTSVDGDKLKYGRWY